MNSAFDFKETLDFPFRNTTQAKKFLGRFSEPYQVKIYRISTRLNTTPRASAHVEAVRGLAFRWLARYLRSKTFGLGKSMQIFGFGGWVWQMFVSKRNDAQSPKSSDSMFSWHANLENHALSMFHPFFGCWDEVPAHVCDQGTRKVDMGKHRSPQGCAADSGTMKNMCSTQGILKSQNFTGLMSELLELWEEPIFFWTMSLGSVAFEIIRPWKPFKASMSFCLCQRKTHGDSFRTSSVNRTWPTRYMNSNIHFSHSMGDVHPSNAGRFQTGMSI